MKQFCGMIRKRWTVCQMLSQGNLAEILILMKFYTCESKWINLEILKTILRDKPIPYLERFFIFFSIYLENYSRY